LTVIFSQPLVPGFDETKLTFYYPKWMLNLRSDTRFQVFVTDGLFLARVLLQCIHFAGTLGDKPVCADIAELIALFAP
jgi:hypothetical protein